MPTDRLRNVGASSAHRLPMVVTFTAIVLGTFLIGLSSPWFYNDHFDSLSRARQLILTGQQTMFDSLDWGRPLQIYLSAAFQYLSGNTLLGEALLTVTAIAVTVGLVFLLTAEITGSRLAGLVAALLTLWIEPRLYNYPKLLAPTVGLWLIWRMVDHSSPARAVALGAWTGVAFLLRHDLGVYVGVASALAVLVACWTRPISVTVTRMALVLGAAGVVVTPYLVPLAMRGDVGSESQRGLSNLLTAATLTWRSFDIRSEAPLRFEAATPPKVTIRWRPGQSDAERVAAEQRLGLRQPHDHEPPRTWSYHLDNFSREDLRRVVNNPDVEDTALIDRSTLQVIEPWSLRLGRDMAVFRVRPADWLWSARNAETWIYDLFVFSVPLAALLLMFTRDAARLVANHHKKVWTLIVLAALPTLFLIRNNLDSRLADAAPLSFVLVVWVLHFALFAAQRLQSMPRTSVRMVVGLVLVLTWSSLVILAGAEPVTRTIGRLAALPANLSESLRELRQRPIEAYAPEGSRGLQRLARWLLECTSPDDRILVVGYYPEIFYYSERAFAGGMPFFHQPYFTDIAFQRRIVDQLRRERVPLVVAELAGNPLEEAYFHVGEYVREKFRLETDTDFGGTRPFQILVNQSLTSVSSEKYPGLPCFR